MKKILVANRGEIAVRVMRAAREMGIATVAVYSDADRSARHVQMADEAIHIGPSPSKESYLVMEKMIAAAKQTGADAIHPGYGFLSENALFAKLVEDSGLIFIGPTAASIEMMGNKLSAKEAAKKFGIPLVPGSDGAITDIPAAKKLSKQIGFPVLLKAAAGGGGKGMRVVQNEAEFEEQMQRAQSEAQSAFGDAAVFIEKYVGAPRHIEVQVLADTHGNVLHLFERECSIQRRHQKVVEEAPSAILNDERRKQICEAAVMAAKACNYRGAGTVEFLVDENLEFYFLEMNTRLQVEHPVTEFITGVDLVKEQIRVARGEKLSFTQADLKIRGHAIELRVCAENPMNNFLPDIGRLEEYVKPEGPGVRVDDGYAQGMDIPVYYDPLLAKLIAHGSNRSEAIGRLLRAIDEYKIAGLKTTLPFGRFVLQHPAFVAAQFDTNFVGKYFTPEMLQIPPTEAEAAVAAQMSAYIFSQQEQRNTAAATSEKQTSAWVRNRLA